MGAVFKGLCQTGAWGCFDEFNRIPIEVLSVVSTQFACILNALREQRDEFDFMGEIVSLVPSVGAFITMNPGYAGRTELPENLKALFRSCAMVVPDIQLICENMLMSEGFLEANRLSKKFVTLYGLSRELLSKQMHYDWGLRATKAVLRVAGGLKRAEPQVNEDVILMRALRDFNLPKLVDEDKPIFIQLVKDLFPGIGDAERKCDMDLEANIRQAARDMGLQSEDMFVRKCIELAELFDIRHSVFVIGDSGTGKSEIWKVLFRAFNMMQRKTVYETINPKAVQNNELYGWLTKTEWHDGILSTIMRNMSRNNAPYNDTQQIKAIVLDGDIDPEWIESLNTVMDDNKVLTLVSNERIPVTASMRLLFEISNLDNATPATVSRAGILYINQKDVGTKPFLDSWIEKHDDDKEKSSLLALFNKYTTPEYLNEMVRSFSRVVPISEMNMVQSLCHLLDGLMTKAKQEKKQRAQDQSTAGADGDDAKISGDDSAAREKEIFEANFVFACIWAFGGSLLVDKQCDHRKEFSDWWKRVFTTIKFPKEGTVFDYYPDTSSGRMVPWKGVVPDYEPPNDAYLVSKVFVPTVETVRLSFVTDLLVRLHQPVLMVGTAGTGKTTIVREYLSQLEANELQFLYSNINLNAYTDAKGLQSIMETSLDKRSGRVYGPEANKRLVYFIDDLNMPYVDTYGTQSPSCLIRQHMDYGTWFDTTKLEKKEIHDVQYLSCMNPTAGSFTIDDRLMRHFATFACQLPSDANLKHVYSSVLKYHLEPFSAETRAFADTFVQATIDLHKEVSFKFLPSTTKFHYQFNLRDLSNVFQGMCMSSKSYSPFMLKQLWEHECTRVFADRLITPHDCKRYFALQEGIAGKHFKEIKSSEEEEELAAKARAVDRQTALEAAKQRLAAAKASKKAAADLAAAEASEAANSSDEKGDAVSGDAGDAADTADAESGDAAAAADVSAPAADIEEPSAEQEEAELKALEKNVVVPNLPLLFSRFVPRYSAGGDSSSSELNYHKVDSVTLLKKTLTERLDEYNESNAVMNLELFGMAMEHVCRIARIIENPRGNALLVGVGGSGKQSLARLASSICGYDIFQISVTQTYGMNDLKTDLQDLYRKTGVKGNPVTFLLTDAQIVDDQWLVYINDLLSSGDIPDLFTSEEKDGIYSSLRNEAKANGIPDNRRAMQEFFINRVRANLHVVLCFSPVGETFRVRCRKFPALINCTSVDWFHPWPRDALVSVARRFLQDIEDLDERLMLDIAEHMAEVHLSVNEASERYKEVERRYNYTTPKSFLELIAFYKQLLQKKREDLQQQTERLEKGITVLQQTQKDVSELQEDLTKTLVRVEEKKEAAAVLIQKMGVERGKVEKEQAIAAEEATKAKAIADNAQKIKADCDLDMKAAAPVMQAAQDAVNCIQKNDLTQLKSFANPPAVVLDVTKAVLILKNNERKNHSWNNAKKMMNNVGKFLGELQAFDATTIPPETLKALGPVLALEHFSYDNMISVSSAAANLCNWVVNVVKYNGIYTNIEPKMEAQAKANEEYLGANEKLAAVEAKVADMVAKLKELTDSLTAAVEQKNAVEAQAKRCTDRLALAKRLVDGLGDENERWTNTVAGFKQQAVKLPGDVMLASAFVSYIGAFNQKFRDQLWEHVWIPDLKSRDIPITENVDPLTILASQSDFARWKNEGLPADRMSLENGALMTQCTRWPLLIDPQLQGIKWLKNREGDNLQIVQIGQKRWLNTIVQAVQNGQTVVIENVGENIDATLDPILSRSVIKRGRSYFIKVGSEEVAYDPKFRLFLQTKLSNPHYKPEVAAQCTLINFIVTEVGLEDQLLARVVNREKPELEEKRTGLVRAINQYMVTLTDLENQLLERLSNAPDDILSDVALIEGLEKTKEAAIEIEQKVQLAKEQEISINETRNEFRGVAAEGSWLYFLLTQLCVIDHMYQYSLDAFTTFFLKAMEKAAPAETTAARVVTLRESIRYTVFQWVNRGLFEKHKLIFLNQLCFKLMQKGALGSPLYAPYHDYLIRAPKKLDEENPMDWLPDSAWANIEALAELKGFEKFATDVKASPNRFKEWYTKSRPEAAPLPLEWRKLDDSNPFMKLMIVRAMRNDRMTSALTDYVRRTLPNGSQYTECDAGKSFMDVFASSLQDSTPTTPVFFILSPGADPVQTVEIVARKNGMYDGKFHRVALGQGQDVVAMNRLEIGHKTGHWVVLENIHLMPSWTHVLEKRLDEFAAEGSHPDFRVFLSAEPSNKIPIGLLERSIKLTNEPPQGLKANLKRAFASFDKDEFEFKDAKVKSILFGLCHFHSIIVERIKFGPKGWNRPYPFNTGDLMNSSTVLSNYLADGGDKVPWADLRYIFGEILYGGHITDDWDRLLCNAYLKFYMREELLDEMELFPFSETYPDEKFRSPPVMPYDDYFKYIDQELTLASPVAFGLHPNAEIGVRTAESEDLFKAIMDLQPRDGGTAGEDGQSPQERVESLIDSIMEKIKPVDFNLEDIASAIVDDRGPYQNVFMQECDRMNQLTSEMRRSLNELQLGLSGELQMSGNMETLFECLFLDRVPTNWTRLAYPSLRNLESWIDDMLQRAAQLQSWVDDPINIPVVVNVAYLFNPQSFLTAIMQTTAQRNGLELDKLVIQTDVSRKTVEQTDSHARDGAYVTGLHLEGARWNWGSGVVEESLPREMSCEMPVINCRAVLGDKLETSGYYRCPVYTTSQRGPTYVFTANLRSKLPADKWVLSGASLVMEVGQ
jgi:ABC-type dipeptide/oligopeptide/nickel transport system ATPase component